MKSAEDIFKKYAETSPISKEQYQKAKSKLSETDFKKQYIFQKGIGSSEPDKYYAVKQPKSGEIQALLSAEILTEIQALKKAQTDGTRHLKTLKRLGWVFIGLAGVAVVFFIQFVITLSGFINHLTDILNGFVDNLATFNGFMETLTSNLNNFIDNLAALNGFIDNLTNLFG